MWLSSIGLFAGYLYLNRKRFAHSVYVVGITIAVVAVIGIVSVPFIPPPLAAGVPNIDLRPLVTGMSSEFLAPFTAQMYYLLAFSLLSMLVFSQRRAIVRSARRATNFVGEKMTGSSNAEGTPSPKKSQTRGRCTSTKGYSTRYKFGLVAKLIKWSLVLELQ